MTPGATVMPRACNIDTLEKFRRWKPENGFKYEWNNGTIEKSPKMITKENFFICDRLIRLFQLSKEYGTGGNLLTEPEFKTTTTQLRIPDMAYFSAEQFKESRAGKDVVPPLAIEFVSDDDTYKKCLKKIDEYFSAGVQVVWFIFPELQRVYVYLSPRKINVCMENDQISAAPVLPDFKISAQALFV